MVKVVAPLFSAEARGSVGALTYNTHRGVSIVKTRSGPSTQHSTRQDALRACAASATAGWQALTDQQREAWNDFARDHPGQDWTGNPKRLTGYNWYLRINSVALDIGWSLFDSPPAAIEPALSPTVVLSFDGTNVHAETSGSLTGGLTDPAVDFWCTAPHGPARFPDRRMAKHRAYATHTEDVTLIAADVGDAVEVWTRFISSDTGYPHLYAYDRIICQPQTGSFTVEVRDWNEPGSIQTGALLTIDGLTDLSNPLGIALVDGITPGAQNWTVSLEGYETYYGGPSTIVAGETFDAGHIHLQPPE